MIRWPYPRMIAHRGGGTLAPENTLAAIRHGAGLGFRAVEFDVMLASDGVPVLIHDETLARTTGQAGRVPDTPAPVLAALDAGGWCGARWRGEGIPRFTDAARLCRELGLQVNVEIKPAEGMAHETAAAVAALSRELWSGAPVPPLLSSFSVEALATARDVAPELPRGHLVDALAPDWRQIAADLGCVAIHCDHRALTRRRVEAIHAAGYAAVAWTVNHRLTARKLLGWGVDSLVTDALDRMAEFSPGRSESSSPLQ